MNYFSRVISMVKSGSNSAVILAEEKCKSCIKPPQTTLMEKATHCLPPVPCIYAFHLPTTTDSWKMHLQLIQFSTWFNDAYTIKLCSMQKGKHTITNKVCKAHIFLAFSWKLIFFPLILKGCSVDFFPFRISFHIIIIMNIYSVRSWTHWVQWKGSIQNLLYLYGVSYRITRKMAAPGTFPILWQTSTK